MSTPEISDERIRRIATRLQSDSPEYTIEQVAVSVRAILLGDITTPDHGTALFMRLESQAHRDHLRRRAREEYRPHAWINPVWHPIYQDECERINDEHSHPS